MNIQERIHARAYEFATAYGLGKNKLYARLISAGSIPFSFLVHALFNKHHKSFVVFTLAITFVGFIIHSIATSRMAKEEYNTLIVHHLIGVFLMLCGIPFKIKMVIFGFILFHMVTFIHTLLGNPLTNKIPYVGERTKFFFTGILCGISMNIFLRLILWIVL